MYNRISPSQQNLLFSAISKKNYDSQTGTEENNSINNKENLIHQRCAKINNTIHINLKKIIVTLKA